MRLCATSVVWLKSGLGHLIKIYLLRENGKTNCRCRFCQERQESGEPSREDATIIRNERSQHLLISLAQLPGVSLPVKNTQRLSPDSAARFLGRLIFSFFTRVFYARWLA